MDLPGDLPEAIALLVIATPLLAYLVTRVILHVRRRGLFESLEMNPYDSARAESSAGGWVQAAGCFEVAQVIIGVGVAIAIAWQALR